MTLLEKQWLFVELLAKLTVWTYANGYKLTEGESFRTEEQAMWNAQRAGTGIVNSLHRKRLAKDYNLFINGVYQTSSEMYKPLGEYWKTLHPLCRWGGDFSRPDGNHFSIEHEGVK